MACGEFHWFFWMWWRFCHRFGHSEICYIVTHFSTKEAKEKPHVMDMIFLPIFHTHQKGTFDFLSCYLKSCLIIRRCRYLWYLKSSVHYCTAFYTHITIRLRNSRTVNIAHNILHCRLSLTCVQPPGHSVVIRPLWLQSTHLGLLVLLLILMWLAFPGMLMTHGRLDSGQFLSFDFWLPHITNQGFTNQWLRFLVIAFQGMYEFLSVAGSLVNFSIF